MNKRIIILLTVILSATIGAEAKTFFDMNSNIIGVTGNYQLLYDLGYKNMLENNQIGTDIPIVFRERSNKCPVFDEAATVRKINEQGIGKQVLDFLFLRMADGTLSEELLKERALRNARFADVERAQVGVLDAKTILKEDYLPILLNNYIVVKKDLTWTKKSGKRKSKSYWYVFHVDITKQTWQDVFAAWNDANAYNNISVKVSYVGSFQDSNAKKKIFKRMANLDSHLALRAPVVQNHPITAEFKESVTGGNPRRFFVYRQKQNAKGELRSSKVSTVLGTNREVNGNLAMYTVAGGTASASKGDIAVYRPDANTTVSLNYIRGKNSNTYSLNFDHMFGISPKGKSLHFLYDFGGGSFDHHKTRLYEVEGKLYRSPYFFNIHTGLGMGFNWFHCLQVMPYFTFGYEGILTQPYDSNDDQAEMDWTHSVHVPLGIRASLNLFYPLQITGGVQYNLKVFSVSLAQADKDESAKSNPHEWNHNVYHYILDPAGLKRSGLEWFVGLRYKF